MAFFLSVWVWCNASALHASIALWAIGVAGTIFNWVVRRATAADWSGFAAKHPRIAGLFLIAKGLWPETATVARGIVATATGQLREREAAGDAPTPKPRPAMPPPIGLAGLLLLLSLAMIGCASGKPASGPTSPPSIHAGLRIAADGIVAVRAICVEVTTTMLDDAKAATDALTREAKARKAQAFAHSCDVAAQTGLDALASGEAALEAYDATKNGELGCALGRGLESLHQMERLLTTVGRPLPKLVADAFSFGEPYVAALGSTCPVSPTGAPASSDGGA